METLLLLLLLGLFDFDSKVSSSIKCGPPSSCSLELDDDHTSGQSRPRCVEGAKRGQRGRCKTSRLEKWGQIYPNKGLVSFSAVSFIVIDRNTFLTFLLLQQHYTEYNIQRPGLKFQLKTSVVCVANFNEQQGKGSITETFH